MGTFRDRMDIRRARYGESIYRPSPKARRPPDQRSDGLYSVHAVAARAGVKPAVIRYWARKQEVQYDVSSFELDVLACPRCGGRWQPETTDTPLG